MVSSLFFSLLLAQGMAGDTDPKDAHKKQILSAAQAIDRQFGHVWNMNAAIPLEESLGPDAIFDPNGKFEEVFAACGISMTLTFLYFVGYIVLKSCRRIQQMKQSALLAATASSISLNAQEQNYHFE